MNLVHNLKRNRRNVGQRPTELLSIPQTELAYTINMEWNPMEINPEVRLANNGLYSDLAREYLEEAN